MRAREILETALYTRDLAAAERFYTRVLGLEVIARVPERHVFFRCGNRVLLVFDPAATVQGDRVPAHGTSGAGHVAFAASEPEVEAWRGHLQAAGVAIEMEYTWPGGGRSLYFRDPAGNCLEIATPAVWGLEDAATLGTSLPT